MEDLPQPTRSVNRNKLTRLANNSDDLVGGDFNRYLFEDLHLLLGRIRELHCFHCDISRGGISGLLGGRVADGTLGDHKRGSHDQESDLLGSSKDLLDVADVTRHFSVVG